MVVTTKVEPNTGGVKDGTDNRPDTRLRVGTAETYYHGYQTMPTSFAELKSVFILGYCG